MAKRNGREKFQRKTFSDLTPSNSVEASQRNELPPPKVAESRSSKGLLLRHLSKPLLCCDRVLTKHYSRDLWITGGQKTLKST